MHYGTGAPLDCARAERNRINAPDPASSWSWCADHRWSALEHLGRRLGRLASRPSSIGSTNFEEQAIVANLYGDVLKHAGYPVTVEPALGTRAIVVPALDNGQIDIEPDYAGVAAQLPEQRRLTKAANNITTADPQPEDAAGPVRASPCSTRPRPSTPTCSW